MKILVLAEKPSVAREIARVLNCNSKNRGFIEGKNYVVTWALGHLVTLAEPHNYDKKYKSWRLEDLPMLPEKMKLKVIKQTYSQFQVVQKLLGRQDIGELIIATDAGREGELVARWIMAQAHSKKPFKRLWISSQTDAAIREGFAKLKPGKDYNRLYHAAVCRAEADWLIGLNVTRALTCKYNAQLSAGRVQTPTLALIVQREEEINKFKPVNYWTIRANFGDYFGDWRDKNGQSRIFEQNRAGEIAARVQGKAGIIRDIKTVAKSESAPLAYDLTELQRDANRRFAFSAKKTLSVLQGLYEYHKLVTYPRTDSRYITSDIVPTLQARLQSMGKGPYTDLIKPLVNKKLTPGKRLVDNSKVTDHHAIIPTEQPLVMDKLNADEKKLYDLIARRFIAVLYPPYRYDQTTLITEVNSELFYSRGNVVKERGWRVVNTHTPEKEDTEKEVLPVQKLIAQKKGTLKEVRDCKINRAQTRPPARYTEATLLTAMESAGKFIEDEELRESIKGSGLGTPATRAEIIEKLFSTFYVERRGKELVPTSKGKQLISLAPEALRSPELTANWEQRLTSIAEGKGDKDQFIAAIRQNAAHMVKNIIADTKTFKADNLTKDKCPVCGEYMLKVNSKKGKMLVCSAPACGYKQRENQEGGLFSKDKHVGRLNQQLIRKYSDNDDINQSLGDKLKAALAQKQAEKDK
ncbi:MAG: DNA topoisomerase III [Syntrophomonadaceae bacterium]|nr:DNA topoisomerase III [Syntrophomonadaceae bacterium]MDD4549880.1 DNA topoisomerase III [Syntrophomonadaceae bacterium]